MLNLDTDEKYRKVMIKRIAGGETVQNNRTDDFKRGSSSVYHCKHRFIKV